MGVADQRVADESPAPPTTTLYGHDGHGFHALPRQLYGRNSCNYDALPLLEQLSPAQLPVRKRTVRFSAGHLLQPLAGHFS
jgi:hypothetical protein